MSLRDSVQTLPTSPRLSFDEDDVFDPTTKDVKSIGLPTRRKKLRDLHRTARMGGIVAGIVYLISFIPGGFWLFFFTQYCTFMALSGNRECQNAWHPMCLAWFANPLFWFSWASLMTKRSRGVSGLVAAVIGLLLSSLALLAPRGPLNLIWFFVPAFVLWVASIAILAVTSMRIEAYAIEHGILTDDALDYRAPRFAIMDLSRASYPPEKIGRVIP